jgi:hypothetical protein
MHCRSPPPPFDMTPLLLLHKLPRGEAPLAKNGEQARRRRGQHQGTCKSALPQVARGVCCRKFRPACSPPPPQSPSSRASGWSEGLPAEPRSGISHASNNAPQELTAPKLRARSSSAVLNEIKGRRGTNEYSHLLKKVNTMVFQRIFSSRTVRRAYPRLMCTATHNSVLKTVHSHLQTKIGAKKGERVLISVSGGLDSIALLRLMLELQHRWGKYLIPSFAVTQRVHQNSSWRFCILTII